MTAFTFFGTQLFVIYSVVGHLGLVVASGALAALGFALRQWPWASLAPRTRANAKLAGASVAGAVGMTLVLGLRVSGTAYDPSSPMFWEWLTARGAGAGLVAASYAFGSATTGAVLGRSGAQSAKPFGGPAVSADGVLAVAYTCSGCVWRPAMSWRSR